MSRARDVASRDIVDGSITNADVNASAAIAASKLSGVVAQSLVDAKGDLLVGTAADTVGRLAVGTNGQVLSANSSASTGLEWVTLASGGETQLASTTMSGNSVSLTSIAGTYKHLRLILRDYTTTATGTVPLIYVAINNGVATHTCIIGGSNTAVNNYTDNTRGQMTASGGGTVADQSANLFFPDYANAVGHKTCAFNLAHYNSGSSENRAWMGAAIFRTTSAITSIQISLAGSETFNAGTAILYGVN